MHHARIFVLFLFDTLPFFFFSLFLSFYASIYAHSEGHEMRCTFAQICTTRAIVYWARTCMHMIWSLHTHIYTQMLIGGRLSIAIRWFIHSFLLLLSVYSTWLALIVSNCHFSSSHMSSSHRRSTSLMRWTTVPHPARPLGSRTSLLCFSLWSASPKVTQKILRGPSDTNVHPGDTVQLPCIVARRSDAIVTWCWNDFCTLGKTHLLRHETTSEGLISIYQYTAYPRFQLFINERLSTYWLSRVDRRSSFSTTWNWNSFRRFHFAN